MQTFESIGLSGELLKALDKKGFVKPSPVQAEVLPILLNSNDDIIVQAQTGTGKTAAFGLPMCQTLEPLGIVRALILAPTRELAIQVCDEIKSFSGALSVLPVYGGQPFGDQGRALIRGADIVAGTPGRVIDMIKRGKLVLDNLQYMILDEVDEMLNMGFIEDVEFVLDATPKDCQRLMFSATLSPRLEKTAHGYLDNPRKIKIETCAETQKLIDHVYFETDKRNRLDALTRYLALDPEVYGIIFCQRKVDTETLASELNSQGISAEYLHGDIAQNSREVILTRFKNRKCKLLIATDVAARGIDVTDLTHVINYSVPESAEAYTHRCGRTGRRGQRGTALTMVISSDMGRLKRIRSITKFDMVKQQVPNGEQIATARFDVLKAKLEDQKPSDHTFALAKTLLEEKNPTEALAALLQHFSGSSLDPASYRKLTVSSSRRERAGGRERRDGGRERRDAGRERPERGERSERSDRGERRKEYASAGNEVKIRLEKGLNDDFGGREMVRFIERKSGIPSRMINGLSLKRSFCTFMVPEKDAQSVVSKLNKRVTHEGQGTVSVMLDKKS
ncbi:MAG: DEAD/DEAH box helicase [Lentisphaeraceae bacterium]|nr:DEAD/DEAH box helicase [Lentisphaeraceae bacterium]